jgi:hypothetical protein
MGELQVIRELIPIANECSSRHAHSKDLGTTAGDIPTQHIEAGKDRIVTTGGRLGQETPDWTVGPSINSQ